MLKITPLKDTSKMGQFKDVMKDIQRNNVHKLQR